MFGVLTPDVVRRKTVVAATAFMLPGGLQAQVFTVPGKVPLYLESDSPETASETEANVGTELCAGNARIVYIPGAAAVTPGMLARMEGADIVFFDGTLFRDDEMITTGTGAKTGRRMGHMPIDGEDGSSGRPRAALCSARLCTHQQHQSDPDRRFARAPARGGQGLGNCARTEWRSTL